MPSLYSKVWNRKNGEGVVLAVNVELKRAQIMWHAGYESEVNVTEVKPGGRPRK